MYNSFSDEMTDSCTYDSGGPAVVLKHRNDILLASARPGREAIKAPKSAILAGVTSWGHGCAQHQKPGVYVKLESFLRNRSFFFCLSSVISEKFFQFWLFDLTFFFCKRKKHVKQSWIESTLVTLSSSNNDTQCGALDHFLTKVQFVLERSWIDPY